jgi:hypothetical protein
LDHLHAQVRLLPLDLQNNSKFQVFFRIGHHHCPYTSTNSCSCHVRV